ncbi:post-GPI attachment to proteins factor 6 [Achroia grisella]|uniref:post-GPI attachment to proteins factor 6 n=1 Tax=Achroia grisella TaxID=688607 RepID=UPI0027D2D94F|nr:post-GPI attachment to proteins factor 6 [Achroia grisella]
MRASLFFLLVYVYMSSGASNNDKEIEEERNRKRIIEQLTRTRTVLHEDYDLISRQVATDVYMFRSYRTVSVVFYPVMIEVSDARFTFQSEELHLNNIGSCDPQEIIVHLKYGSYPAVNPDGYDFPKDFVDPATRENIYTLELTSDGRNRTYDIKTPKPGQWYALIYIKWEDPRTQALEQQGLVADCQTIIYTDLQVKREKDVPYVNCYAGLTVNYTQIPSYYKCMSLDKVEPIRFNITIRDPSPEDSKKVSVRIQAQSLPSEGNNILSCAFDLKLGTQSVVFTPNVFDWHYIHLDFIDNTTHIADCDSYLISDEREADNYTILELMRNDRGRFFTFDALLPTTDLQDTTSLVNISSNEIKTLRFNVHESLDIGGTLSIDVSLVMSFKYYMGYKRELQKGALLAFTEDNQYFKAVICLDIGHSSIPLETGECKYNDQVKPALFVLNSTDSDSINDQVIIPYPESGTWYLTFRIFCDDKVCPCRTTDNGTKYYVETIATDKDATQDVTTDTWREGTSECNATVILSVSSTSCVAGRCSNHGNCLLNTFGGIVMSFCSCSAGYGGWDCSDDSRMDSRAYMLISILLLTLSNLLFIMSIYVAIIRLYYTEAMMYGFTMIFSTFYHACDAPAQVAYCIITGNILQFGDFYCGIMSFWVTLLAMSIISERFRSSLQLIGAIVIALLTTWNRHSFVAFVFPVVVGLVVLMVSWYLNYRKYRKMKYPRSYYRIYLPLGLLCVSVGLICYGFLQTEQNYKVVHSLWHMIVAVSVVFLLPDNKRDDDSNPFVPSPNYCRLPSCRIFRRTQTHIAGD